MTNRLIPIPKKREIFEEVKSFPLFVQTDCPEWSDVISALQTSTQKIFGKTLTVGAGGILLHRDSALAESHYTLDSRDGLVLSASDRDGICYAVATLLQLMEIEQDSLQVESCRIEDFPDKSYRTLMIDLAREWHPAYTIDRYIDVCFFLKVKYLHLHFIDDQRYTLPSRRFPEIVTPNEHYTFEQIKHMNDYAKERGVVLVPEFEAPGHAASMVSRYPEYFANHLPDNHDSQLITEEGTVVTAANIMCAGNPKTMEALKIMIDEICEMFPESPYIHIGGDEANIRAWNHCSECVAYMKEHGIEDEYELYSDFIARVSQMVLDSGRTPIVWEGFPTKGAERVPRETVVIAWESHYHLVDDLISEGFKVINGSWQPLYITYGYNHGRWSARDIYNWDVYNWQHWWEKSVATVNPIHLPATDRVIGAQISSWECTYDLEICRVVESASVLSERTWNVTRTMTLDEFQRVLAKNNLRLGRLIQDR